MTEPTAEQVAAERERASEIMERMGFRFALEGELGPIATALARVRLEAHAAGRDEGLREAYDELDSRILGTGCSGDVPMSLARDAIRALRGRT